VNFKGGRQHAGGSSRRQAVRHLKGGQASAAETGLLN